MNKTRNTIGQGMIITVATLFSAFAGETTLTNYWKIDTERSGIVRASSAGEPAVLNMQGRKVVMQVRVDRVTGLSYKARFFHVDPDLTKKGWVMADVKADSNPALQVNGRPLRCNVPSTVAFDGMLTVVYPASEGMVVTRKIYPSQRNPVVIEEWHLRNAADNSLSVDFRPPDRVSAATENTLLVFGPVRGRPQPWSNPAAPCG